MAFNPNLPANHSPVSSAELRNQLNGLKTLIDSLQSELFALQADVAGLQNGKANVLTLQEFDYTFNDPPTTADLQATKDFINSMVDGLTN